MVATVGHSPPKVDTQNGDRAVQSSCKQQKVQSQFASEGVKSELTVYDKKKYSYIKLKTFYILTISL